MAKQNTEANIYAVRSSFERGGETLSFKAKLLFFFLAVTLFITCIKIVIN